MKELSEDAKNNAAFATSAASPNLPIGMYFSNRSSFSFNLRCWNKSTQTLNPFDIILSSLPYT